MTGVIIVIHTLICILLATVILMQSGRGGGLTEGFASAESMFGAQTNEFMIRATTILSCVFLVTCLSLAFLSSRKDKSIMDQVAVPVQKTAPTTEPLEMETIEIDPLTAELPPVEKLSGQLEGAVENVLPESVPAAPAEEIPAIPAGIE